MIRNLSKCAMGCLALASCVSGGDLKGQNYAAQQYSEIILFASDVYENNGEWLFDFWVEAADDTVCIDALTFPLEEERKGAYVDVRGAQNIPLAPKYNISISRPTNRDIFEHSYIRLRKHERLSLIINISNDFDTRNTERLSVLFPLSFATCNNIDQKSMVYITAETGSAN